MTELVTTTPKPGLVARIAERYGVEPEKMLSTLKATAFRTASGNITNEQMMALLIVAERHGLDPFTKEIYAYPDKGGGIVPVVGVDGWINIAQSHEAFDGWEFEHDETIGAATCTIWRKDRSRPTRVTEYITECRRETDPWKKSPRRMIRNRAIAQCVRLAFGFAGIHDDDEAQVIAAGDAPANPTGNRVREALSRRPAPAPIPFADEVIDMDSMPAPFDPTPAPAAPTVADYLAHMATANKDDALDLLDRARTDLTDEAEYTTLVGAYRARFSREGDE
jgi:phage recombination protein Bet